MKQSVLRSLSEKDTVLLLETKRKSMEALDEDALVQLHGRVQRARNKHSKNYRRAGAVKVAKNSARGRARPANRKNRDRAEVFEDALARVSRRLAVVARESARELRAQRLAQARGKAGKPSADGTEPGTESAPADRLDDRRIFTPEQRHRVSTQAAAGNRKQGRKDNR